MDEIEKIKNIGKDTATETVSNSSADIALDSITQTIQKNDI